MKKYLELELSLRDTQSREMAIASLHDLGFYGFLEEEDHVKAYHENIGFLDFESILTDMKVGYKVNIIEEENWNAQWESSFEPVRVDDFVVIRADFHARQDGVIHDIIITPKMSFGTGHHSTTLGMIRLMKETDFKDKKVMDFGTGTGVLAIIAEKCGASEVHAIDIDEWSISNALENISRNTCEKISVWKADQLPEHGNYDIILANINLHVLLANRDAIHKCLKSGGTLIISGLMKEDEKIITEAYFQLFDKHLRILKINDWLMFIYSKK